MQGGSNIRLVEAVVERLLTSAVADMAVSVRRTVLESMKQMSDLDSYLAQADWYAFALQRSTDNSPSNNSWHALEVMTCMHQVVPQASGGHKQMSTRVVIYRFCQ